MGNYKSEKWKPGDTVRARFSGCLVELRKTKANGGHKAVLPVFL